VQATKQAIHRRLIDNVLAGSVGVQCLGQKHRQRFGRRELSFAVFRQALLNMREHFVTGEHVKERVYVALEDMLLYAILLLAAGRRRSMHGRLGSWCWVDGLAI
jgi:hypothetical protein